MESIQSLSQSNARADGKVSEFRGLYRIVLIAEALFGLGLLICPAWTRDLAGLPELAPMGAAGGVLLLWAVAFQVTGLLNPVYTRLPVVIGVLGRYALVLALWAAGAALLGLLLLVATLALNLSYHRMVRAVVMSRP